jgi:hypothetical protein
MKRYILILLLGLGLIAFVPQQVKADEYSIGPVTVYRHHSSEWYRERERMRERAWREHQWREHQWREQQWRERHMHDYPD